MQDAENQWEALAIRYKSDQLLVRKHWHELYQAYSASGRYYHTLEHIQTLLQLAEKHKGNVQQPDAVRFAIFYHDIIYSTTRSDNEEKSAAVATERLQVLQVTEETIQAVQEMIVGTKSHQSHSKTDVNFMVDIDLAILGADWERYVAYSRQIRKEYRLYPDLMYKKGRKKVLQHFLRQPAIYKTALFHEKLETQARQNLQQEIDSM